jgi:capsular polysaccharide export protein
MADQSRTLYEGIESIAILSPGVWRLREAIQEITGMKPVRWWPPFRTPNFGCVVGWGLKPTSRRARALSETTDSSYLALEDGFIRSIRPGPKQLPLSLIVDHKGVHYDAGRPSEFEELVSRSATNFDHARLRRARHGIKLLRSHRISKFNHAPELSELELGLDPNRRTGRVLVIDQTAGDASIAYGQATPRTFRAMLQAARAENPEAEIVVKLHPEVVSGTKKGHLEHAIGLDTKIIGTDVNPWSLIDVVDKVYVVTSQMGFEAVLAGKQVICFGVPFYAGWGLTQDRVPIPRRKARPTAEQLFAAAFFEYSRFVSPTTRKQMSFEDAIAWLVEERRNFFEATRTKTSMAQRIARVWQLLCGNFAPLLFSAQRSQ